MGDWAKGEKDLESNQGRTGSGARIRGCTGGRKILVNDREEGLQEQIVDAIDRMHERVLAQIEWMDYFSDVTRFMTKYRG